MFITSTDSQTLPESTTTTASFSVQTIEVNHNSLAIQTDDQHTPSFSVSMDQTTGCVLSPRTKPSIYRSREWDNDDRDADVMPFHRGLVNAETELDGDDVILLFLAQSVDKDTQCTEIDKESRVSSADSWFQELHRTLVVTERLTDMYQGRFRQHSMNALWCCMPLLALALLTITWCCVTGFMPVPGGSIHFDRTARAAYDLIQPGGEGFAFGGGEGCASYLSYYNYRVALAGVMGRANAGRIVPT